MDRHATPALTTGVARTLTALVLLTGFAPAFAQVTLTQATNFTVDVAADGRVAMDLLGDIWTLPARGGKAAPLADGAETGHRPRWAPDGSALVYQRRVDGRQQLRLYRFTDRRATAVGDEGYFDQHPAWHPSGERIVFSSDRRDTGFDLWELDLATRLSWRITNLPGDETEPVWSADGRDLVYVHRDADGWSLMLRPYGEPDRVLVSSPTRLSAPSWRPDGTLVTFVRHAADGLSIDMVVLSEPLLIRPLVTGEDFFVGPVAWRGRQNLLYTANGHIRTRSFNAWSSRDLPFRATVRRKAEDRRKTPPRRNLPAVDEPRGDLVVRAARLFDGVTPGYRDGFDVVIHAGRIAAVEARRDRDDVIVVDLGDLTILPGYIDADARLPATTDDELGPALLAFGITTLVADHPDAERLNRLWSGNEMPGPRLLAGGWAPDLALLTTLVPGADALPVSPAGIRYEDARLTADSEPTLFLSGLADARTPGLDPLLESRQAALVGGSSLAGRRYVEQPRLAADPPVIVACSRPNELPPGVGLHAELLALVDAGLRGEDTLRAAGVNAAGALGLPLRLGRIAPGAVADLVIVDGDPLGDVADARKVVGVVRNGRFYSAIGLIDRAGARASVE